MWKSILEEEIPIKSTIRNVLELSAPKNGYDQSVRVEDFSSPFTATLASKIITFSVVRLAGLLKTIRRE